LSKVRDLSPWYLNEGERKLLNLAEFFSCFLPILNPFLNDTNPVDLLEFEKFLSNKYAFQQTLAIIKLTEDEELYKFLESLGELNKITKKSAKDLLELIHDRDKSSAGRLLYKRLSHSFLNVAKDYKKEWPGREKFTAVSQSIIDRIEPAIRKHGFTGEFPHYRRISRKKGHYISFFSEGIMDNNEEYEFPSINISLGVALAPLSSERQVEFSLEGLPFEETNSSDCFFNKFKCRFTSIGPSDDEGWFKFYADNKTDLNEEILRIQPYIEVADRILKNKPLPKFYLKHHRHFLRQNNTARKLASIITLSGIFFGLGMWVFFGLLTYFIEPGVTLKKSFGLTEFLISMASGAAFGVLFGGYVFYDIRRKAWPS
jgi:hypothetical protein